MATHEKEENPATPFTSLWTLIWKLWSSWKQAKISRANAFSPILRLPDELLLKIIDPLPVLSRSCLSLSCKRFYRLAGSALASDELQLPPLVRIEYGWGAAKTWRWVFLGLVQDRRWLRCPGCIKLRPSGEFPFNVRYFHENDSDIYKGTCEACHPHGGIVYLCPCVRMSFQDKLELISQLDRNSYPNKSFGREEEPWHKCEKSYQSARVQVQLRPALLEDGELLMETEYNIKCETERLPLRLPYFSCPHTDIDELVSMSNANRRDISEGCSRCDSSVVSFETFRNDNKLCYSIRTRRNLGPRGSCAEVTWKGQRCKEYSDPFKFRRPH